MVEAGDEGVDVRGEVAQDPGEAREPGDSGRRGEAGQAAQAGSVIGAGHALRPAPRHPDTTRA